MELVSVNVCEQRRVVTDILLDTKLTKKIDTYLLPSEHEWDAMAEISSTLAVLTSVTTLEQNDSCSHIYPIVRGLIASRLNVTAEELNTVAKLKDCISSELRRRFEPESSETASSLPVLPSLLDPSYKRLQFLTSHQRRTAQDDLESRLDDVPLNVLSRQNRPPARSRVPITCWIF